MGKFDWLPGNRLGDAQPWVAGPLCNIGETPVAPRAA